MKQTLWSKKNRLFLLLLLAVFFVGVSGRLLCKKPTRDPVPFRLTVRTSSEDALLLSHLSAEQGEATLDGIPVSLSALTVSPSLRTRLLPEGAVARYESRLFSEAEMALLLEGELREGRLFAEGVYLPLGKSVVLETLDFVLTVRIMEIKTG
ncbi:MAG: hypothetical protein J6R89_03900 [Clostridia bacterium]|nr:hypothetical protein [Clostridia bacterium]